MIHWTMLTATVLLTLTFCLAAPVATAGDLIINGGEAS